MASKVLYIFLEQNGVLNVTGKIDYPLLKEIVIVELLEDDRPKLESIISDIKEIMNMEKPPNLNNKPICKKCAYYDLCFI